MSRNGTAARTRLESAALELYESQGFDATTTAEIATCAQVSERTLFRHFADKREVLFGFEHAAREALTTALASTPRSLPPLAAVRHALLAMVSFLEANREASERREVVIAATPALQERQLAKAALLTQTVADALRERAVPATHADLAAHIAMATFSHSRRAWLAAPNTSIAQEIVTAFTEVLELVDADNALAGITAPTTTAHAYRHAHLSPDSWPREAGRVGAR